MFAVMTIDYKEKYLAQKEKEEAKLQSVVEQLVRDVSTNTAISKEARDESKRLADHVATQNGRIGKLEKAFAGLKKKRIELPQVNSRVLTLLALAAVILLIIVAVNVGASDEVFKVLAP